MLDSHVWRGRTSAATLVVARTSQAGAIAAFDRLLGSTASRAARQIVPDTLRSRLEAHRRVSVGSAELMDDFYSLLELLLALHREFAQRLFEVLEADPPVVPSRPESAGETEHLAEVVMLRSGHQR